MTKLLRYISLSVIALFLMALNIYTDPDEELSEKLKQAAELVESADEAGAMKLYEEVLEENHEQVDALWNLSVLYAQRGYRMEDESEQKLEYNTADEYAERCLEAHPEKAPCHFAKALAIGRMAEIVGTRDRIRKSIVVREHAVKAVELDPEFPRSWHLLGVWHSEVANLGRKEKIAARALFGGLPKGASNEQAEKSFDKAMELRPESILVHLDYARHFRRTGDKEKAIELLQQIENLEPMYKDDPDHLIKAQEMLQDLS